MRLSYLVVSLMLFMTEANAQQLNKPPIDTAIVSRWPSAMDCSITLDGKFVQYKIQNQPRGGATVIVQSRDNKWRIELVGVEHVEFSVDSRNAVFMTTGDSLAIMKLGNNVIRYIHHVKSYRFINVLNACKILCLEDIPEGQQEVDDLMGRVLFSYQDVIDFLISPNGENLILKKTTKGNNKSIFQLEWLGLTDNSDKIIWKGRVNGRITMDDTGEQIGFLTSDNNERLNKIICYKSKQKEVREIGIEQFLQQHPGWDLGEILNFSQDGRTLFFNAREKPVINASLSPVPHIWSYMDAKLQSQQVSELRINPCKDFLCEVRLDSSNAIIQLQKEDDQLIVGGMNNDFILLNSHPGDASEWNWSSSGRPEYEIVFTATGRRQVLNIQIPTITPDHRFVLGYDIGKKDLYSYDVTSGLLRNMTKSILGSTVNDLNGSPEWKHFKGLAYAGYMVKSEKVLLYDQYDLWQVDPSCEKEPVNLTDGYGRRNRIILRIDAGYSENIVPENVPLILNAFDEINKKNGFYKLSRDKKKGSLEPLIMGPYVFNAPNIFKGQTVVKAGQAEVYVIQRQSVSQSPNYFWTTDWKILHPISEVYPESRFTWMTSRLCSYKSVNGDSLQGVLYQSETFDSTKRYPVILQYYEIKSDDLNRFHFPLESNGELDISWFVSRGYLIFTPDIHYTAGNPGKSALNSIEGAATYLHSLPFVNSDKMGLQGHSFGGYETNYIITHCDLFKAAVSSSGASDLTAEYFELWGSGQSKADYYENRQGRMGLAPWQSPENYVANSPIFNADKVVTPVLLISNPNDHNVSFQQGITFFTALRHLGKKAWMLQYDGEGHGLSELPRRDYMIRMTQFFDYFLKGGHPANWLLKGIDARNKGADDGLELSGSSRDLPSGLVLKMN